jgi:hypothetical protein
MRAFYAGRAGRQAALLLERFSIKRRASSLRSVLARTVERDRDVRRDAQLCRGGAALVNRLIHADPACFSLLMAFSPCSERGPRGVASQKDVSFQTIVKIRQGKAARNGAGE